MKTDNDSIDIFYPLLKLIIIAIVYYWVFDMANRAVGAIEDIRDAVVQMAKE